MTHQERYPVGQQCSVGEVVDCDGGGEGGGREHLAATVTIHERLKNEDIS